MPSQPRRPRLGSHSQSSPNLSSLPAIYAFDNSGTPLSSPLAQQQFASTGESFPELNSDKEHLRDDKRHGVESATANTNGVNGKSVAGFIGPSDDESESDSDASDKAQEGAEEDQITPQAPSSPRHGYMSAKASSGFSTPVSPISTSGPTLARLQTSLNITTKSNADHRPPARPSTQRAQSMFGRAAPRSQSSTNLSASFHHTPAAFAPPFYNRPPTPLPPSPSLTSLLRPSFSSSAALSRSRSATPSVVGGPSPTDSSSDTDATTPRLPGVQSTTSLGGLDRAALAAPSSDSVRRAAPVVPTYEYYGFVLYLGSSLFFMSYVLWASLPTPILHGLGVTYYPSRWWSLAVPCWIVAGLIWIYVALASYNTTVLTEPVGSVGCFVDKVGAVAIVDENGKIIRRDWRKKPAKDPRTVEGAEGSSRRKRKDRWHGASKSVTDPTLNHDLDWRSLWNEGTDAVLDVPIGGVCEVLYGELRDRSDEEDEDDSNDEDETAWDQERAHADASIDTG